MYKHDLTLGQFELHYFGEFTEIPLFSTYISTYIDINLPNSHKSIHC